jgi:hypothetical protein
MRRWFADLILYSAALTVAGSSHAKVVRRMLITRQVNVRFVPISLKKAVWLAACLVADL